MVFLEMKFGVFLEDLQFFLNLHGLYVIIQAQFVCQWFFSKFPRRFFSKIRFPNFTGIQNIFAKFLWTSDFKKFRVFSKNLLNSRNSRANRLYLIFNWRYESIVWTTHKYFHKYHTTKIKKNKLSAQTFFIWNLYWIKVDRSHSRVSL